MDLALKVVEKVLPHFVSKEERLSIKIKRIKDSMGEDTDELNKRLSTKKLQELRFEFNTGIKADIIYHKQLEDISILLPKLKWSQIKDAFKVWNKENNDLQMELTPIKRIIGSSFFVSGYSTIMTGGIFAFFVSYWEHEAFLRNYFLFAVGCFIVGFILMVCTFPYQEALNIQKRIVEQNNKKLSKECKIEIKAKFIKDTFFIWKRLQKNLFNR